MNNTNIPIVPIICGIIIGILSAQNIRINEKNTELTEQLMYAKEGREYLLEVATHFHCMQPRQKDIRDCLMSIQQ
jgi:hypothetical protein